MTGPVLRVAAQHMAGRGEIAHHRGARGQGHLLSATTSGALLRAPRSARPRPRTPRPSRRRRRSPRRSSRAVPNDLTVAGGAPWRRRRERREEAHVRAGPVHGPASGPFREVVGMVRHTDTHSGGWRWDVRPTLPVSRGAQLGAVRNSRGELRVRPSASILGGACAGDLVCRRASIRPARPRRTSDLPGVGRARSSHEHDRRRGLRGRATARAVAFRRRNMTVAFLALLGLGLYSLAHAGGGVRHRRLTPDGPDRGSVTQTPSRASDGTCPFVLDSCARRAQAGIELRGFPCAPP
ncbi:hypothetical protein QJS66_02300 [Kocuria rhizophila]|nr:hypothetical protein QJS66_02300 [Kocuria rhizophila]